MYQLIELTNNKKVITQGSYLDCLGKFHGLSNLSFRNHKEYSYNHYDIIKITK